MKFPKVGQTAWIHPITGHEVAPGWQDGQQVKVISERRDGLCYVTVEKPTGERIEVPHFELDCGREYQSKTGEWLPENDPRVLRYLVTLRDQKRVTHGCGLMELQNASFVQKINHVLQRNDWELRGPLVATVG